MRRAGSGRVSIRANGEGGMTKLEMMRQAVKELGEATAADLAVFIEQKYGVKIDPKVIPILRASVRDKEMLESFHEKRRVAAEKETPNPPQAT
jgi:hypothetical protein